jgi:hypothetical protein
MLSSARSRASEPSRENTQQGGYTNVDFYQFTIDKIPHLRSKKNVKTTA